MPTATPASSQDDRPDPTDASPASWRSRLQVPPDLLLSLVVFFACAWFYNGAGHDQNARLDAIYTFVEPGPLQYSFRLDPWLPDPARGVNTPDWAEHDGRYYANKAPGSLMAGAVVYALIYHLERARGIDPTTADAMYLNAWLLTIAMGAIPLAISVPWLLTVLRHLLPGREGRVLMIAAALYLGTLVWTHSTQFWGYGLTVACVIGSLRAYISPRRGAMVLCGLAAGAAVLMAYTGIVIVAAYLAVLLILLVVDRRHSDGGVAARRRLLLFIVGGIAPFIVHAVYHQVCFGAWYTTAWQHANPDHPTGGGLSWPRPLVLIALLLSPFRGLFWLSPVLILAVPGFERWLREGRHRRVGLVCLLATLGLLLLNSAVAGWHGGNSVGPRYLIPILPMLVLALAYWPSGRLATTVLALLLAVSILQTLAVVSVTPIADPNPAAESNPVHARLRSFVAGEFTPHDNLPVRHDYAGPLQNEPRTVYSSFNVGDMHGLPGLLSLTPLLALCLVLAFLYYRANPAFHRE